MPLFTPAETFCRIWLRRDWAEACSWLAVDTTVLAARTALVAAFRAPVQKEPVQMPESCALLVTVVAALVSALVTCSRVCSKVCCAAWVSA